MPSPDPNSALREKRPIAQLSALYRDRDPQVMDLGVTFFGIICRYVDPKHFVMVFASDLDDLNPALRKFACDALARIIQA